MVNNITEQEIKYALREITHEPDEKLIERIQDYFELYPETLKQLTDEKFKETFIKLLYNYDYLHRELMDNTTETEATGRIILEVLMKENGLSQEEINELLDRNCWRKATQFSVKEEDFADYGNYKKKRINWKDKEERSLSAEEVLSVIDKKFKEAEKVKELEESNKWLQRELKNAWSAEDTHIEVMHDISALATKEINKHQEQIENLKSESADKSGKIKVLSKDLGIANSMIRQLQTGAEEKDSRIEWFRKELDNSNTKLKETEDLLYLSNKPLPPLPKKQNKFKLVGIKLKNKLSQLAEKTKSQVREMVARIEVKSK